MEAVTSKDGTTIAFDRAGEGAALILVGGAFEQRAMHSETAGLAASPLLARHFTVYHYDRRGRGDSGDTLPFAVEREIEDIAALIDEAGGEAFLFGISSGAALALEAALALGDRVRKVALYEAPYNSDEDARREWIAFRSKLETTLAEGRRGDAVGLFMMLLGMPEEFLEEMHQDPLWPMFEEIAPTIAYDAAAIGEDGSVPVERAARLRSPTLVLDGAETPYPFMHTTARALAGAIPDARHLTLEGQTHEVDPEVLAPVLVDFFTSG